MNRKWILVVFMGVLILSLAACSGTSVASEVSEEQLSTPTSEMASDDSHSDDADAEADTDADTETDTDEDQDDEAAAIDAAALYSANCSNCHGADRAGGNAPPLLPGSLTKEFSAYVSIVTDGSGPMPAWGSKLSMEEINALVEFILSEVE